MLLVPRSYDEGVAALSYLLLPISGLIAFLTAADARVRFHGSQAIALGLVWPLALYAASLVSVTLTQVVFALGVLVWATFAVAALVGRDPVLPGLAGILTEAAGYERGATEH